MIARAVLPIVILVILIGAATPAQDAKKEAEKLQGQWVGVSWETRGFQHPAEAAQQRKLTVKGDGWIVKQGDEPENKAAFKIDPSKDPKTIDLTFEQGKFRKMHGIYKLEGDTLTVCLTRDNKERPKEFKTSKEDGILMVWKRGKK
jgi:uncharacterized protein (TIGR03067 family)